MVFKLGEFDREFPPPGYKQAESKVKGIEIYLPDIPVNPQTGSVQEFHCPQCGGTTAYNIANQGLQCSYCGYLDKEKIDHVGRQAHENEFTLKVMDLANRGWGSVRQELECSSCGAKLTLPDGSISHTCPFCNSNKVIQQAAEQPVIRPGFIIPFAVNQEQCVKAAVTYLGKSWMVPANLRKFSAVNSFVPIYFSFWSFDAGLSAQWKAQVGHTQQERYYDPSDRTWKTHTKIVWRWEQGVVSLRCDDLIMSGTSRLSRLHLAQIDNFNFNDLVKYTPVVLAGFRAKAYDITLEKGWENARNVMRDKTRQACLDQASTSKVRNFSMNIDFKDESWRSILLPIYLASYSYGGKTYQVLVNGQTGSVSGQRPVDWQKIWLVIALILLPGMVLGLAGLVTIPLAGVGILPGVIGIFLFMIGCVVSVVIGIQANRLDDA